MKNEKIRSELIKLRDDFNHTCNIASDSVTEEKIRSGFLNKLFELFGWNLSDISEVVEEKRLTGQAKKNLERITSSHSKPDYFFCENSVKKMVFDAKNITEDFKKSKTASFQIRSYSWSLNLPLAMISNFKEFGIYDTTFTPDKNQDSQLRAIFFTIDDLIDDFDKYSIFFDKKNIQKHSWSLPDELSCILKKNNSRTLDIAFFNLLENFRISLGEEILDKYPEISITDLNYYVQIIINRILFIRILEDLNFETFGTLKDYLDSDNFWRLFSSKTKQDFEQKYDGALFSEKLPEFELDNKCFKEFIKSITVDTPYRFDIIKPSFMTEIYDQFLGRQLVISDSGLKVKNKSLSPEGSVPTPTELSYYICQNTLNFDDIETVDQLLNVKIIDPCVGSGSFLLSALELLIDKYKKLIKNINLSFIDVKLLIQNCLYGVDIDPTALEVLKMTLSLKIVTSGYTFPERLDKILSDLTENFRYGNTIVQANATYLDNEEFGQTPTNFQSLFPEIMNSGGFDFLVTNPPYIEPKHFKKHWPNTLRYLKKEYGFNEKIDVSMFFLKRISELLKDNGQYGIVIQKRFFKTEYGKQVRDFLGESRNLISIHDFSENGLFRGKTTYIACLFAKKNSTLQKLTYVKHSGKLNVTRTNIVDVINNESNKLSIEHGQLKNSTWSYELLKISEILNKKCYNSDFHSVLGDVKRLNLGVGPQVLDKKFYFLDNLKPLQNDVVIGKNKRGEDVKIEQALLKPVILELSPK